MSTNRTMDKKSMIYSYNRIIFSNKLQINITTWMDLKNTLLNGRSQILNSMIPLYDVHK